MQDKTIAPHQHSEGRADIDARPAARRANPAIWPWFMVGDNRSAKTAAEVRTVRRSEVGHTADGGETGAGELTAAERLARLEAFSAA